ncbi:DUF748 domain-containing protein [Planctobacterium marinum]
MRKEKMKKLLIALLVIFVAVGGFIYMGLSGLDGFIKEQLEKQGTTVTKTNVTVNQVETVLSDAKVTISGLSIANPQGYSQANAFGLHTVKVDLGTSTQEPYVIDEILIDSPEVVYEVNQQGKANLVVLKDNIQASLPQSAPEPEAQSGDAINPLMSVKKITVKDVKFTLDIAAMDLGEIPLQQRQFELTLPTFQADAIGVPNGIPADQLGAAIVDSMLDNLIKEGKNKVKALIKDQAEAKLQEKLDEEKAKLEEKAKEKLKSLFDN